MNAQEFRRRQYKQLYFRSQMTSRFSQLLDMYIDYCEKNSIEPKIETTADEKIYEIAKKIHEVNEKNLDS